MMGAAIPMETRTDFIFDGAFDACRIVEDILEEFVVPFIHSIGDTSILIRNNVNVYIADVPSEYATFDEWIGQHAVRKYVWEEFQKGIPRRPIMLDILESCDWFFKKGMKLLLKCA
ncbi:hypothetical protein Trydic_g14610 [Trypoxylus dichotomus]